jgi:hypothetical protein
VRLRFLPSFLFTAAWLAATSAQAATSAAATYSWANPTPAGQLRELATDRPDATESPFTVDVGHVQLELDLVNHTRNRLDGVRTTEWGVAPFNLRFGIQTDFELGIFLTPYVRSTEEPRGGPRVTTSGVGDTTVRAKWNFFGNNGGGSASGLIVDVKLPTAARGLGNDKVEGAFILPVACDLPGGWSFGAMTGVGAAHDGARYRALYTTTATLGHEVAKDVDGYVEITSEAGIGPHLCTFNVGLTWLLDANRQVDAGVNCGVSRAAPDVTYFVGFSRRY